MFKECADIQTADMLKLPVPALVGGKPTNIQLKPSEIQKQMVTELGERADKIRNKMVKPYEDNMLKITNDGRKLALDQRLIDPDLPDDPDSKVNICVGKIFEIWEQTMPQRSAQLVFCDLSTPKAGVFNVYDDMKAKLIERGIPETEIAFIHEANTDARKTELFGKVRSGAVRVLMGSTAKMGAGTNVQKRLIALHHLDVPWRPSDIEQREGRILRQGNENKEVYVFRYVTEGTFDAYSWQLIENGIEPSIEKTRNMQIQLEQQLASAEEEVKRPFPQATELTEKSKRLAVLEGLLNMNDKDIVTDTEPEQQCQTDNRQRGQEER